MPQLAMSAASSITLAACSSALEGMQPTFRHTPPEHRPAFDQGHLEPEIRGAKSRRIAARARAEHDQIERARRRRRRRPRGGAAPCAALDAAGRGRGRRHGPGGRRRATARRAALRRAMSRPRPEASTVAINVPARDLLTFLDLDRRDHAADRRGHVHRSLLGLERDQRIIHADLRAHRRPAHRRQSRPWHRPGPGTRTSMALTTSAFTSLKVLLRNTTKRAASAPSMTR